MSCNYNRTTLVGRLTKDPDMKQISDSTYKTSFILAVGRNYKREDGTYDTDFIPVKNPKSDDFLYVTVDGNRRITLTEVSDREVRARFTDLLTEKKIKKWRVYFFVL